MSFEDLKGIKWTYYGMNSQITDYEVDTAAIQ